MIYLTNTMKNLKKIETLFYTNLLNLLKLNFPPKLNCKYFNNILFYIKSIKTNNDNLLR